MASDGKKSVINELKRVRKEAIGALFQGTTPSFPVGLRKSMRNLSKDHQNYN
jgi:hypothetical protein